MSDPTWISVLPPVLAIVLDCTDTLPSEAESTKGPWRERKEAYLAHLVLEVVTPALPVQLVPQVWK